MSGKRMSPTGRGAGVMGVMSSSRWGISDY